MKIFYFIILTIMVVACTGQKQFNEQLRRTLKEDPKILTEAIEENPNLIIASLQNASRKIQETNARSQQEQEQKQFEEYFNKPLSPLVTPGDILYGKIDAPITLVMYSDFQCPYCTKGHDVVKALKNKYGDKLRFVYKHLPLDFHKQAMPAAHYFEAIKSQEKGRALKFMEYVYGNQPKLNDGDSFLKGAAVNAGANMVRLASDIQSSSIHEKIKKDMDEAASFGIQGTPGFILNGIPIRGAYPVEHFIKVVEELKQTGKLAL